MLRLTRRGEVAELGELTADEDLALRRAFGRYSRVEDRTIGAAVVRRHKHSGAGRWFLCDCLGDVPRPPTLVPVTEDHIRRRTEAPWPAHDPACDFYRDQAEQRLICGSYARVVPRKPIPLVTRYKGPEHTKPAVTGRSRDRHRGRLATLLMTLLEQTGLTRLPPGQPLPSIAEQYRALRTAAREIELEEGVALASFLCTYLPALPELMAKIARTPPERFRRSHRPHGLLVTIAAEAAVGQIRPLRGDPIPVRGESRSSGSGMGMARSLRAIVGPGRPTSQPASSGGQGRRSRSRCSRPTCTPAPRQGISCRSTATWSARPWRCCSACRTGWGSAARCG